MKEKKMASLWGNPDGTWNYGSQIYGSYSEAKRAQERDERRTANYLYGNKSSTSSSGGCLWAIIKLVILGYVLDWCLDNLKIIVPVILGLLAFSIYSGVKKYWFKKAVKNWKKINEYPEGQEDYSVIIPLLKENDEKYHDSDATYSLFCLYASGTGVEQNEKTALSYLQKAAEKGHTDGCFEYAKYILWNKEDSTEEEKKKGFEYLQKAAHSNRDDIRFELAMAHYYGTGTKKDEALAMKVVNELAEKGFEEAIVFLQNGNN